MFQVNRPAGLPRRPMLQVTAPAADGTIPRFAGEYLARPDGRQ